MVTESSAKGRGIVLGCTWLMNSLSKMSSFLPKDPAVVRLYSFRASSVEENIIPRTL